MIAVVRNVEADDDEIEIDAAELAADLRVGLSEDDARAEARAGAKLGALGWRVTRERAWVAGYVAKPGWWVAGSWQARVQRHDHEICATGREPGVIYRRLLGAARMTGRPPLRLLAGGAS